MSSRNEMEVIPTRYERARRGIRLAGRVLFTLAVIAGSFLAVRHGAEVLGHRADAAESPGAAPPVQVITTPLHADDRYSVERSFVGQVEAQKSVAVSFELPGRLAYVRVEEGDAVAAGQVLAVQDTSLLQAERRQLLASRTAAEAQLRFADQTLERSEELNKRGFASQARLDQASARRDELVARIAEIDAALLNVEIRAEKATLTAPFDGRVTERFQDGGEALGAGQAVLRLVETRAPRVRIGVALDVDQDVLGMARIDVGGHRYEARLLQLRPDIDPVTRTRTAIFGIETDTPPAFGQVARLILHEEIKANGFWVPLTSLQEGLRGQWTVLTVDPEQVVRAAAVEILHAETDRVFVRSGFPEGTRLVGAGPQRVTVGQRVTPVSGS